MSAARIAVLLSQLPSSDDASSALREVFDPYGLTLNNAVIAVLVFVVGIALSMLLRRMAVSALRRGTAGEAHSEVLVGRIVQSIVVMVAMVYALGVVGVRLGPLLGALGIGGIAIALALQPTLQNLFSGIVLHAQRPFRVGDEVVTGDISGVVKDITSRAVVIRCRSGETIHIPNSTVLDREITNLVRYGRRRTTLSVGVAYGTDVAQARDVLERAVKEVDGVLERPGVSVFAARFDDSAITFDVDFWHGPQDRTRRETRDKVIDAIHRALGDEQITIPFPQRTVWMPDAVSTD